MVSSKFWSELNSTCRNWGHFFSIIWCSDWGEVKKTLEQLGHMQTWGGVYFPKNRSTIWGFVPRFWGEILNIKDTILYYFILHFIQYSTACWAWILRKPPFALLSPNVSRNSGVWITCHGRVNTCLLELEGFHGFLLVLVVETIRRKVCDCQNLRNIFSKCTLWCHFWGS